MYLDKCGLRGRVTGGASGIGAACADALLEAGARVVVADHSDANLVQARDRLGAAQALLERLDVTDSEAAEALTARLGAVDILVNNAGIGRQTPCEDIADAEWHGVMSVNLTGVFWCARAFGRSMLARGRGAVINVGSMAGDTVVRPQRSVHHSASKAGVHHLTKSLAAEWAARGVRVNAVVPSFIETPMNALARKQDVAITRIWLGNTPMPRA